MHSIFHIPLPDHLIKWCSLYHFDGQLQPFKVNENSVVGKDIIAVLSDQRSKELVPCDYVNTISFELSVALAKMKPSLIKLGHLRSFIENDFKKSLEHYTRAQVEMGQGRYKAVQSFLKSFQITEQEFSIDTAYQIVKRVEARKYTNAKKETSIDQGTSF
jgi:hypothetical protein